MWLGNELLSYLVKYRTSECSCPVKRSSVVMAANSATEGFEPFVAMLLDRRVSPERRESGTIKFLDIVATGIFFQREPRYALQFSRFCAQGIDTHLKGLDASPPQFADASHAKLFLTVTVSLLLI